MMRRVDSATSAALQQPLIQQNDKVSSVLRASPPKAKLEDSDLSHEIRKKHREKDLTVETDVKPGDTIQSVALRFNVPVAEIKRVNNLINEKEFFAMKRVRIPVRPHSFLAETLVEQGAKQTANNNGWTTVDYVSPIASDILSSPVLSDDASDNLMPSPLVVLSGVHRSQNISREMKKTKKIFKSVDKDLENIRRKNESIVSTIISSNPQLMPSEDEDDYPNEEEEDHFLLPKEYTPSRGGMSKSGRFLCGICVTLVVVSVLLILWLAKHEFNVIKQEDKMHLKNGT